MVSVILDLIVIITIAALAVAEIAGAVQAQPNFIVIQPDDHYFFEEWDPPGQFDGGDSLKQFPPNSNGLPNINRIRHDGIEMKSAYAASTMCGTSRYSTITGRYPSRSSYGRAWDVSSDLRDVKIPRTKLEDVEGVNDPNDCSENNIAALLKRNGYQTGVVGKWHLTSDDGGSYSYSRIRNDIKGCGFDFAEAIYKENLWGDWYGDATHNMEHVTSEAIHFIEEAVEDEQKPFFLYFNPTVPHKSGDVTDALRNADCRDTIGGRLSHPPDISYGMTADFGGDCRAYRQSVLDRGGSDDDKMAGAVWIDDAIGSLFQLLENMDILDNTFILFQLDHGEDSKGSLFEGGSRIVQFIHYPDLISSGSSFQGFVSTIDVAATIAEAAGLTEQDRYGMDGTSWLSEVAKGKSEWSSGNDRCVFVEEGVDRSIRCGCYKYILIKDKQDGRTAKEAQLEGFSLRNKNYYNLCDEETGKYINAPKTSPEKQWASLSDSVKSELVEKIDCHLERTKPSGYPKYDRTCDEPLGIDSPAPDVSDEITNPWTDSSDPSRPLPAVRKTKAPTVSPTSRPTISVIPTVTPTNSPKPTQKPTYRPTNPLPISVHVSEAPTASSEDFDSSNSTEIDLDTDCSDDLEYLYDGEDGQDCQWVIENDRCDREDPKTKLHVGEFHCPESCFYCQIDDGCFDNPNFQWYGQEGHGCAWLAENNRCDRVRDSANGTHVHIGRQYCPESCSYCSAGDNTTDVDVDISK